MAATGSPSQLRHANRQTAVNSNHLPLEERVDRALHVILALALLLAGIAIIAEREQPAGRATASGDSLASLVPSTGSAFVIVYDPSDCFRCDSFMPLVQELEAATPERVKVVLTSNPTEDERVQLALLGISSDQVLRSSRFYRWTGGGYTPEVIMFEDGVEVASEPYRAGSFFVEEGSVIERIISEVDSVRAREEAFESSYPKLRGKDD